ncbi:hypothetical protein ASPVEDRAFT_875720 [Aspergillus versicolor CBS 583.65]|uniref:Uncharacterized protein n=1 Tax=Aspergillus versicolor CBS 583.65 TaxID=1036611 RepID=A0A1L9PYT8_ASPVE|nr:uncharacterized protein ASPVEDRAFT_875720 [Aspergillus versicolor CBS 583.65]OJJ06596.1 hypothetical protein ASPVEDRAFT_875720 [Aspergillus versicolor CBS 583.65]
MLFGAILLLSAIVQYVTANALAGPYQSLYIWYAYRMEIEAFGAGSNQIASGLKGSAPDGTCYFDELMDGLQRAGQGLAPGQHTSVGKELAPDVAKTAKEIRGLKSPDPKGGTKAFVCNIDSDKLFKPGQSTKPMNSLQDLLDNVTDRIDAARNKVGDEALGDALKNAQMAISGVQEQRIRDMGQDYINTVNDYLKNEKQSSTKVTTDQKTDMEGNKGGGPRLSEALGRILAVAG